MFALIGSHARFVVATTGVCTCVWFVTDAFKAYAGRQSDANIRFGVLADIRMVYTVRNISYKGCRTGYGFGRAVLAPIGVSALMGLLIAYLTLL